jgi:hypothetical protein
MKEVSICSAPCVYKQLLNKYINRLAFVIEKGCAFCKVKIENLYILFWGLSSFNQAVPWLRRSLDGLSQWRSLFHSPSFSVRFMVDDMALVRLSLLQFRSSPVSISRPDRPWGLASLLYNGYRVIPGVKRPGSGVDHPPHLVQRLKKE